MHDDIRVATALWYTLRSKTALCSGLWPYNRRLQRRPAVVQT